VFRIGGSLVHRRAEVSFFTKWTSVNTLSGRFMGHIYYFSPIHAAFIKRYENNPANATLPTQE
jgi:hypothetical protein